MKNVKNIFLMLLCILSGVLYAATPIANWTWNEGSGASTTDLSGNDNVLQLGKYWGNAQNDPTWVTVDGRKCGDFNQYSDGLTYCINESGTWVPGENFTPVTYTIEMILKYDTMPPASFTSSGNDSPWTFLSMVDPANSESLYQLEAANTAFRFWPEKNIDDPNYIEINAGTLVNTDDWIYLSIEHDGFDIKFTVRNLNTGESVSKTEVNFGALASLSEGHTAEISVGSGQWSNGNETRSVDALIDEIKISGGIVAETDRIYPQPIVDWRFNDGYGADVENSVANKDNMRLKLGKWWAEDQYDPQWDIEDQRGVLDFDSTAVSGGPPIFCQMENSDNSDDFRSLTPDNYTIEMVFKYQTLPPNWGTYDNNGPQCLWTLVDTTAETEISRIRVGDEAFEYICGDSSLVVNTANEPNNIVNTNDWLYLSIEHDGMGTEMTIRNITNNEELSVTKSNFGIPASWSEGDFTGGLAIGSRIWVNGNPVRSVDALFDRVRVSSGIVGEAEKLYNEPVDYQSCDDITNPDYGGLNQYMVADLTGDCVVNSADLAEFASVWLNCMDPVSCD